MLLPLLQNLTRPTWRRQPRGGGSPSKAPAAKHETPDLYDENEEMELVAFAIAIIRTLH